MQNEKVQTKRPERQENGNASQENGKVEKEQQEHQKVVEKQKFVEKPLTDLEFEQEKLNCLRGINYYLMQVVDQLNRINNYITNQQREDMK